jgi:hypothetical protein
MKLLIIAYNHFSNIDRLNKLLGAPLVKNPTKAMKKYLQKLMRTVVFHTV